MASKANFYKDLVVLLLTNCKYILQNCESASHAGHCHIVYVLKY